MSASPQTPCILMRAGDGEEGERDAASRHFPVYALRSEVPKGSLVIGRYSTLPHHEELEADTKNLGSRLINTSAQHRYIANLDWYEDLADMTFPTWFRFQDVPSSAKSGAFVVKGRTNSRKQQWLEKMYAPDFQSAVRIGAELMNDGLIGQQGVVLRAFTPLETFEVSCVNGLPFANEWRVFYLNGERLAHGFYWSGIDDWSKVDAARPGFESEGLALADAAAARVAGKAPFVVIDVARAQSGRWMVVELNDGTMSGLNDSVSAQELYAALAKKLTPEVAVASKMGPGARR